MICVKYNDMSIQSDYTNGMNMMNAYKAWN